MKISKYIYVLFFTVRSMVFFRFSQYMLYTVSSQKKFPFWKNEWDILIFGFFNRET